LETYQELRDHYDLVVDLMYGAPSWAIIKRHLQHEQQQTIPTNHEDDHHYRHHSTRLSPDLTFDVHQPLLGRDIMYIHSGGLEGINSQVIRYKYDRLLNSDDIQLPGKSTRKRRKKNYSSNSSSTNIMDNKSES
jgi:hypothetical protein